MTTSIFAQTTPPPIETGVSQALAKWRAANYSGVRYKLNITLEKMSPVLKGTIEIRVNVGKQNEKPRVVSGTDGEKENAGSFQVIDFLPTIVLDWRKIKGKENLSTISNVSVNGRIVVFNPDFSNFNVIVEGREVQDFFENNEHLVFQDGVKIGENIIKLDFTSPIATSGAAVTRYVDKEDNAEYVYSLFVPSDASTAFPVFDQPDLKARFQLTTTVSRGWKIVSNTNIDKTTPITRIQYDIGEREGKDDTIKTPLDYIEFAETKPISTYVFAFAAGDFAEFKDCDYFEKSDLSVKSSNNRFYDIPTSKIFPQPIWAADEPNVYLYSGCGTNAKDFNSKFTSIYVRKSQAEKFLLQAYEVFRLNREGVKFLESWFDYKFPFPKYDLVLIPEFPFGGMEHAGATFLREDRVIFPTEPTKNDYITRANVIFHEAAHQWFGDTVTMKWFDDLWLKEGFAEFMAYKTLEKVMPEYNAWKVFYERNKQAAYLTDVTRGTTPIYQEIPNLSAAKSAYGNIVYRKAPSFLRQAEFYLGEDKFQTAVRAFLKKHEFANAEWTDLVKEFETASLKINPQSGENTNIYVMQDKYSQLSVKEFANQWIRQKGMPLIKNFSGVYDIWLPVPPKEWEEKQILEVIDFNGDTDDKLNKWRQKVKYLAAFDNGKRDTADVTYKYNTSLYNGKNVSLEALNFNDKKPIFVFPNYQDYGYGIFLLDEKSRAYVLENIGAEKDDFLRSMMWGSLWDSVRFYELAPEDYVKLVIKNINVETDESTIQTLLGRVSIAMNYYIESAEQSVPSASAGGSNAARKTSALRVKSSADADGTDKTELAAALEKLLINKVETAPSVGQKITYFRALQSIGSSDATKQIFKDLLNGKSKLKDVELKTKDKFDLVTRLIVLGDKDALNILAELEKQNTDDAAKRYAYAARAGIATVSNKLKYWQDFTNNKEISESYIEAAFNVWNSPRHADLTLPYLEKALAELPNLKKNRKIFFVNGWLAAFIGGQKSEQALQIVNGFLAGNPNLDRDLRLKILENADNLERAVKIRVKYNGK